MVNPTVPPENWMIKMAPIVMVMGAMLALTGLATAVIASTSVDYTSRHPNSGADRALQAVSVWIMPLTLTGVAFVLMAITIFLRGIFKGIRFMGGNVTEAVVKYVGVPSEQGHGHSNDDAAHAHAAPRRARAVAGQ